MIDCDIDGEICDVERKMLTAINDEGKKASRKKSIADPGRWKFFSNLKRIFPGRKILANLDFSEKKGGLFVGKKCRKI